MLSWGSTNDSTAERRNRAPSSPGLTCPPRLIRRHNAPAIDQRLQQRDHACRILVGEHAKHRPHLTLDAQRLDMLLQRGRSLEIMRHIEQHWRRASH